MEFHPSSASITPYSLAGTASDITGFNSRLASGRTGNLWFSGSWRFACSMFPDVVMFPPRWHANTRRHFRRARQHHLVHGIHQGTEAPAVGVIGADDRPAHYRICLADKLQSSRDHRRAGWQYVVTESGTGGIGMINVNSLTDPTQDTVGSPIPIPTQRWAEC